MDALSVVEPKVGGGMWSDIDVLLIVGAWNCGGHVERHGCASRSRSWGRGGVWSEWMCFP